VSDAWWTLLFWTKITGEPAWHPSRRRYSYSPGKPALVSSFEALERPADVGFRCAMDAVAKTK